MEIFRMGNIVNMPQQGMAVDEQATLAPAPMDPYAAMKRHARRVKRRMIIGKKLKFKDGQWLYGLKDEHRIELGTQMVVAFPLVLYGYIRFDSGKLVEQIVGPVIEDFEPPPRSELGFLTQSEWPIGLDGKPTDPYQLRYAVPMKRVGQFGEIFTYVTTTPTALDRVGNLLDMIASRGTFHRGSLPIIELQTDSFASRYGRMVAAAKFGMRSLRNWEPEEVFTEAYDALGDGEDTTETEGSRRQPESDPRNAYREASQLLGVRRQQAAQRHIQANPPPLPPRQQVQQRDDLDDFLEERDDYRDARLRD